MDNTGAPAPIMPAAMSCPAPAKMRADMATAHKAGMPLLTASTP